MNAADLLLRGAPSAIALIEGDARLSYTQLRARVAQAAAAWRANGVAAGERCVIGLTDGIEWVSAFLGLIWLGAIPIAISSRTQADQMRDLMADCGAVSILLEDSAAAQVGDARVLARSAWRALCAHDRAAAHFAPLDAPDDAPAFWLYSSGTTGKPKGIIHAQRCAINAHVFARDVLGATPDDVFYSTSKLFFAYPLANALLAALRLGAAVLLDPEWPNPARVADNVLRHHPTLFFSVPTLYRRLSDAGVTFASVRRAVSAGEVCPIDVSENWLRATGLALVNGYGTTETLALVLYRSAEMSSIRPTPLTRVRSDASQRDGAVRLWFAHPSIALGYSRPVTHDSARFGAAGFSPADLFRATGTNADAGWLFAGRTDQLCKVFGRWVDTVALEAELATRLGQSVRESCIVASAAQGEDTISLHLFVVAAGSDQAAVQRAAAQAIATLPTYQRPQQVHLVSELPRTETGKLRRGALGKMIQTSSSTKPLERNSAS